MNNFARIAACVGLLALGACQERPSAPQIQSFVAPVVPSAQPLSLRPVKWKVYTMADLKKIVDASKKNPQKGFALYALTESGYKDLNSNFTDIERYMKEQGEIVLFLKNTLKERENIGRPQSK